MRTSSIMAPTVGCPPSMQAKRQRPGIGIRPDFLDGRLRDLLAVGIKPNILPSNVMAIKCHFSSAMGAADLICRGLYPPNDAHSSPELAPA